MDEKTQIKLAEHDLKLNDLNHEIGSLKYRVKGCEENQKALAELIRSVDKLANNMENMIQEQQEQGERLERLEQAPADDFKHYKRLIIGYIFTGAIGLIMGAVFALIFN